MVSDSFPAFQFSPSVPPSLHSSFLAPMLLILRDTSSLGQHFQVHCLGLAETVRTHHWERQGHSKCDSKKDRTWGGMAWELMQSLRGGVSKLVVHVCGGVGVTSPLWASVFPSSEGIRPVALRSHPAGGHR